MDPPHLPRLPPVRKGVDALMTGIPLAKGCQAMLPGASDRVRSLNRYSQFSGTMRAELFLARAGIARTMPGVPRARCPRPSGVLAGPEGLAYARCGAISRFSGTFHLAPPLSTTEHPLSNCSVIAQSLPSPVQKCTEVPNGLRPVGTEGRSLWYHGQHGKQQDRGTTPLARSSQPAARDPDTGPLPWVAARCAG